MAFAFEDLEVWKRSLDYLDLMYAIGDQLPKSEELNLKAQVRRAATSIALNIAEGSTGQNSAEQARSVGLAIRSLVETVACQHIIARRNLLQDREPLRRAYADARTLSTMLHDYRAGIDSKPQEVGDADSAGSASGAEEASPANSKSN